MCQDEMVTVRIYRRVLVWVWQQGEVLRVICTNSLWCVKMGWRNSHKYVYNSFSMGVTAREWMIDWCVILLNGVDNWKERMRMTLWRMYGGRIEGNILVRGSPLVKWINREDKYWRGRERGSAVKGFNVQRQCQKRKLETLPLLPHPWAKVPCGKGHLRHKQTDRHRFFSPVPTQYYELGFERCSR